MRGDRQARQHLIWARNWVHTGKNKIWDHFQNHSEESQTTFFSGDHPHICSSVFNCEYPTGPERAFGSSFTRGGRHPQVLSTLGAAQPQKASSLWFKLWTQKILTHQSTSNRNNHCASKTAIFITSFPLVFDFEHWNGLDSFCLTQSKFSLCIKGWVWHQWMHYVNHKKSESDCMVL